MTDLKTTIENAIQRTVEAMHLHDEIIVKRYIVESPHTSERLPKKYWMVYEFPNYVACVPEGAPLTSDATRCYNKS